MTPWAPRAEVETVVADLLHWRRLGVVVLAVDPLPAHGARIGVRDLHPLVEQVMRARYRFPVECWEAPMIGADAPRQRAMN